MPPDSIDDAPISDGNTPWPLLDGFSPLSRLVPECHRCALERLSAAGIRTEEGQRPYQAVADAGFKERSSEWYLGQIENYARRALGLAAAGGDDVSGALGLALKLGVYVREYELLGYEPVLIKAFRHRAGRATGAKARRRVDKEKVVRDFAELKKNMKVDSAAAEAAARNGCSRGYVYRLAR